MTYKGIERGDVKFRHFTLNDEDIIVRNGVSYYKVNYGKNPLEGEVAEDEIGCVACDKVMFIGGRKPKTIPDAKVELPTPEPEVKVEAKPKKTLKTKKITSNDVDKYEYKVVEIDVNNADYLEAKLNEYGDSGWEMCGYNSSKNLFSSTQITVIFKRKRG